MKIITKSREDGMLTQSPKVSIGLAVYNGEDFLGEAIESILAQTFTDFELIISDNASTDKTAEICHRYADQDGRIRYHRNKTNIGGANNENLTFRMARGKYFRWAAHDDVCAPKLLDKCIEILDNDPSAVLANSKIIQINESGHHIRILDQKKAVSDSPWRRFQDITAWNHDCEDTYGLIRTEMMRKTDLQLNYTDSDRTLLAELSLHGKFVYSAEPLFYKRVHAGMSTKVYPDWRGRMQWFDPTSPHDERLVCPHWIQFFHYLRIIASAPISTYERYQCYRHIFTQWLFVNNRPRKMIGDLVYALLNVPKVISKNVGIRSKGRIFLRPDADR